MNDPKLIDEEQLAKYHDELMKDNIVGCVVFDISAYNASGSPLTPAKYADLTAALGTNGANVPEPMRKGGMSVKFVCSSDNKYVQARCMAQNFTTDVTQWQSVDDEPTAGSNNLVKSGGVYGKISQLDKKIKGRLLAVNTLGCTSFYYSGYVNTYGVINGYSQDNDFAPIDSPYKVLIVPIDINKTYKYYHDCPNPGSGVLCSFLDSNMQPLSDGSTVASRVWTTLNIPEGAAYFAMTVQFGTFFTDYQKCCVVENTPYYQKLESSFPVVDNSIPKVFFDNKLPSQTVINKALAYVTALGSNQRIYAGYISDVAGDNNHPIYFQNTEPETSPNKLIIAKVVHGITYDLYPYCEQGQESPENAYIGCYAFYDESLNYISNTFVKNTPRNTWNSIIAPDGAAYIAIDVEFGAAGDYKKCFFGQRDKRLESLPSIENDIFWGLPAKQFPPQNLVKNGYVTTSEFNNPCFTTQSDNYQTLIIPVKEGEIYSYNAVAGQGSTTLELNCFANANLSSKVPANTNFNVRVGENEIIVPAGVSYLCLTIKFGASSQYEGASIALKGSLEYRVNKLEEQSQATESETIGVKVQKIGTTLNIATNWDDDNYLVQEMLCHRPVSMSSNPNANFIQIKKVPKTSSISSIGTVLKGAADDICPAYINDSYIGGNHGWNKVYVVTANTHGKTIKDVGARYSIGEYYYKLVILRVVDENTLWMAYEGTYNFSSISAGSNLVYVDNGYSTSNISVNSASLMSNFYGSVKEASYKLFGDNKELIEDGTYNLKEFSLIENYDILDFISIVNAVISNRPQGGYDDTPIYQNLPGVETLATRAVTYKFMSNGTCLVGTSLYARKNLSLSFDGVVQCMRAGNKIYVPKVLPLTIDGVTYDFTKISDWVSSGYPSLTYPVSKWEDADNAPDRVINFQSSTGFCAMLGYITDRGIEINRKDIVSSGSGAIYLAGSTGKLYPNAICDSRIMNPGDCYSVIAYRAFSNRNLNPTGRTNFASVKVNNVVFVFVDYHDSIKDVIPIEDEWIGKKISVYEKTNNVELLSDDCVGGAIAINSQVASDSYGYIVLKLSD